MSVEEKEIALAAYTRETLATILDAGGDIEMVQVGNETTTGMAGEYDLDDMARLIAAGCRAVRETAKERDLEINVCVHMTDFQNYGMISDILRGRPVLRNVFHEYQLGGMAASGDQRDSCCVRKPDRRC